MAFGLDNDGFSIKRLSDIKDEIETSLKASFGEIATDPDSVFGQIIGVLSKQYADLWELASLVYGSQYPSSAFGVALDNVVQYLGLERLEATSTRVTIILEGNEGTVVPLGNVVSAVETNERFASISDVTITKENVLKSIISVDTATSGATYEVIISYPVSAAPVTASFTAGGGDTVVTIATGLSNDIASYFPTEISIVDNLDGTLILTVADSQTAMDIDVTDDIPLVDLISLSEIWTPSIYEAENKGEILALAGTITQIETAVSGLNSIDNLLAGTTGRALESDTDLRLRREETISTIGAATVETIRSRLLQEVDDIVSVSVVENITDAIDGGGRPPHSFECVIEGGDNQDIAEKIWELKPAGIATTFGSSLSGVTVPITDSQGNLQTIYFSRPTSVYVWCYVEITRYLEETFPTDGIDLIIAGIREWGTALGIGKDVIPQRIYTPIFEVPGVKTADIWLFTNTSPSSTPTRPVPPTANDYDQITHPIDLNEVSIWSFSQDTSNIEVVDIT